MKSYDNYTGYVFIYLFITYMSFFLKDYYLMS